MNVVWRYFAIAAQHATKGFERRHFKISAIGIRADGVVVVSYNGSAKMRTPEIHAEYKLSKKLDHGATVFVVRLLKDGKYGLAMPCSSCLAALRSRRVKKVYFTINDREFGTINFPY